MTDIRIEKIGKKASRGNNDSIRSEYLSLLNRKYADYSEFFEQCTRYEYLSDNIFDYAVYDPQEAERMVKTALSVCLSINTGNTYEYIDDRSQYVEYLWVINTAFFSERIDWGVAIRGAFWASKQGNGLIKLDYSLADGDSTRFTISSWKLFIEAMCLFINQG